METKLREIKLHDFQRVLGIVDLKLKDPNDKLKVKGMLLDLWFNNQKIQEAKDTQE